MPPFLKVLEVELNRAIDVSKVPFFARLPDSVECDLYSISAEDHYVVAAKSTGTQMLHVPFKKAVKELRHYPGEQIHRSHWVSAIGCIEIIKDKRKQYVVTKDGRYLPISAGYQTAIKRLEDFAAMNAQRAR